MSARPIRFLVLFATFLFSLSASAAEIVALVYHDIVPKRNSDPYAITTQEFEQQLQYLKREGYQPISLRTLDDVRAGRATLPAKPVLLTFDDGLKSYYDHAYPMLSRYDFPSVVCVVTAWIDGRSKPEDVTNQFMTWAQLRELSRSSHVEIISHTDDLHGTVPSNAWGTRMAAATTRIYDASAASYESEDDHTQRITRDLTRSVERLRKELGVGPIAIAWPHGEYDQLMIDSADRLGMRYYLTLDRSPTTLQQLPRINRQMFRNYRSLMDFDDMLTHRRYRKEQLRLVEIDPAVFSGQDRARQEQLLAQLLDRLDLMRVNGVLLDAFSADGKRTYFYNRAVPVETDIIGQIASRVLRRTSLTAVYLRVPVIKDETVYRDLAQLNWFNGIVLQGAPTQKEVNHIATIFREFKPAIRIGAPTAVSSSADFIYRDINVGAGRAELAKQTSALVRNNSQALILLHRNQTSDAALRQALDTVRSAGAVHYGYGIDDFVHNAPDIVGIVRPLTERTVVADGP